mgnify:FL=1
MTFAEILLDTMKNEPNEANFFDYLFYTKHYCILLESLKGKSFNDISPEELKKLEISFTNVFSLDQLINLLVSFTTSIKARISEETMEPEYLFDELIYKTLNIKTENQKVIEIFIDCFCNLQIGHCIRTKECPYKWKLNLKDFNNYSIYFNTPHELEDFIEKYVKIPYVIYRKNKSGNWDEYRSAGYSILVPNVLKRPKHRI